MTISTLKKNEIYYSMLRIRRVEERIASLYLRNEMKTPVHLCNGQEAVAVGVCSALEKKDYISSNHRGHGHYLAKGGDLNALIAELHCKEGGCSRGYGGSMHLIDTAVGHMGSSSIVGDGIPIGTGLALSIKMKGAKHVSVVFLGDGAADEGVLYESINFAILKKLPVVFVIENNQWSVCSHVSTRQSGINIFHYAPEEQLPSYRIDGNDALTVFEATTEAVKRARKGRGPSLIECLTYRILGHAGCESQDPEGYRDPSEIKDWETKCPVARLQKELLNTDILDLDAIADMEKKIASEIDNAFKFAKVSPLPDGNDLQTYLFCE